MAYFAALGSVLAGLIERSRAGPLVLKLRSAVVSNKSHVNDSIRVVQMAAGFSLPRQWPSRLLLL